MSHPDLRREFSGKLARPPWMAQQWRLAGNRALFFDRLTRQYGDFVYYRGLFNFYLVNHPTLVKQVLQETNHSFDKNSVIYDRFRAPFGNGLVVAEGTEWKHRRGVMQPLFGPRTVERYLSTMVDTAEHTAQRWSREYRSQVVFDMGHEMNRLALEVAGRVLFHKGFDSSRAAIHRWTDTINRYAGKPPLPIVRSYWFPSRMNRLMKQTLAEFHQFLQQMIDDRRNAEGGNDLISRLLAAQHDTTGETFSDSEVRDEALGMMIGGHETSSAALTWAWYELARHPDVAARLHEELDRVLGRRSIELSDVSQLVFTRMVIDETLRLHPPFWFENRNVREAVELGGERLEQGSLVVFSRYSLHRHPDFWSDPERFDPTRFTPGSEENNRASHAYVPFGGGPRVCIGVHFATLELVVLLATFARQFVVEIDTSDRHVMAANLTMVPKFGLRVRLRRRSLS